MAKKVLIINLWINVYLSERVEIVSAIKKESK